MQAKQSTFGWVLTFAGEKRCKYLASILLAILGAVCQMLPYLVMARVLTRLLAGDRELTACLWDCGLMALLWLFRVLFHSLSTAESHKATFAVLGSIRKKGLAKLSRMPLGDVQTRGSGELKNILVERVDSIEPTLAHVIPEMSSNAAAALATLAYLLFLDWRMALAALLPLPLGMVFFALMMLGYQENYQRTVAATKTLNDTAVEYIGGIEVIKVFGKAKSSYETFVAAARDCAKSYIDWMKKSNFYFTFAMNIMPATLLTVLPIGGLLLKNGTLAPEKFVLIVILSLGLVTPIIGCMKFTDDLAKVGTILSQVTDILTAPELPRPETDLQTPCGSTVALRDVHFGYGETEVLHGISLHLPGGHGERPGRAPPAAGNPPLQSSSRASGMQAAGPSPWAARISARSLRSITTGSSPMSPRTTSSSTPPCGRTSAWERPAPRTPQVEQAARDCGCYDFILGLENGFETVVGSGGGHLSGGERQRISIARAMLKDAPIVILDEATAYTDPENEAVIQESVARLVRGKTLIVISHRLSTIVDADQIVLVNDGRVEAAGTQAELLQKSPLYRSMWRAHTASRDSAEGGRAHA